MDLIVYGVLFWIFAFIFIIVRMRSLPKSTWTTVLKAIPALLAAVFAITSGSFTFYYSLLFLALLLCMLGDIGMELNIIKGLGLFLIAQIIFTGNFFIQSSLIGLSIFPFSIFALGLAGILVFFLFYHRYLQTSEEVINPKILRVIDIYAIIISLTLSSSLLIWLTSNTLLGFIPFVGVCFFVLSDSLIGIREFHHRFQYDRVITVFTYYVAIFLLSLGAIIFIF